jgi:hypothetical protein
MEAKATGRAGLWQVDGAWTGPLRDEDRVFVEVWQGRRRLGEVLTPMKELLRPEATPRPERSGN